MEIVAKQLGAGEGLVRAKNGSLVDAIALLNDGPVQKAFGPEGIVRRLVVDRRSTPAQAAVDNSGQWHSEFGPDNLQQSVVVPSLEDLGLNPDYYKTRAMLAPVMNDNVGSLPVVDLRLLDSNYNPVSGSTAQGTLSANGADEVLTSNFFDLPANGGGNYKIDFRAEVGKTATMRSQVLILQIVRK